MELHRLLFVFNPVSGRGVIQDDLYEIVNRFSRHGYLVTTYSTQKQGEAYKIIKKHGAYYDTVVCAGGDGTLNEAVDALMTLEIKPRFGYIPMGSTNDFASTLNLPTDTFQAVDAIVEGTPLPIDIGQFQDNYFSYIAAFGLFTDVSYGTPQNLKNMFGHAAYVLEGIKRLANVRSWHCKVELYGETIEDDFIFGMVSNSASIGGFTLPALSQSNEFSFILLRQVDTIVDLQEVIRTLLGIEYSDTHFITGPVTDIVFTSETPLAWTLDGEYGGSYKENRIKIHKKALQIMVPSNHKRVKQ